MIRPERISSKRKGVGALEVMLILPILLLLLLAAVEFSATLNAEDQVAEASRQGARVAASSGSETAIHNAIKESIGNGAYSHATITIKYTNADETGTGGVAVKVTVSIPAKYLSPNYLSMIGFDNKDEKIVGTTVMRMESVK